MLFANTHDPGLHMYHPFFCITTCIPHSHAFPVTKLRTMERKSKNFKTKMVKIEPKFLVKKCTAAVSAYVQNT